MPDGLLRHLRLPHQRKALLRDLARKAACDEDQAACFAALGYTPHDRQKEFHEAGLAGADRRVFLAGRRSGKTTAGAMEVVYQLLHGDESGRDSRRVLVAAPVLELAERTWRIVHGLLVRQLGFEPRRINDSPVRRELELPWGSVLLCRSTEGKALDSILGDSYHMAVLDEAARFPAGVWEADIEPTLADYLGHALFVSTPRIGWLRDLWERCESPDYPNWVGVHCTSHENPHLSARWLDQRERQTSRSTYLREYLGQWVSLEGVVYTEWDREAHVLPEAEYDARYPIDLGIDFGTTAASPFVLLLCQRVDDRLRVFNELRVEGQSTLGCAEKLLRWWDQWRYPRGEVAMAVGDIAARDGRLMLERCLRGEGILGGDRVQTRKQTVESGIERVRNLLRSDRLLVHPRCHGLIEEFSSYTWRTPREDGAPEPGVRKTYDHGLDALRYLVTILQEPGGTMAWGTRQACRDQDKATFRASTVTANERHAIRAYQRTFGMTASQAIAHHHMREFFRAARAAEAAKREAHSDPARRGRIR